jgi:hypothetical protein
MSLYMRQRCWYPRYHDLENVTAAWGRQHRLDVDISRYAHARCTSVERTVHFVEVGYCARQSMTEKFAQNNYSAVGYWTLRAQGWTVHGNFLPFTATGGVPCPNSAI